jgi:transcriptional regulator with PAS, ATPase and Fis domain
MKPRILFISICPEITRIASQLSLDLDAPLEILEGGVTKGGHLHAKQMENEFDVVISHGGTAAHIEALVKRIPVITIKLTVTDFLKGFEAAIRYGKPLALLCVKGETLSELEKIAELWGNIKCRVFSYANRDEYVRQFDAAVNLDDHTLIGLGGYSLERLKQRVKEKKLNYVLIRPTVKNVRQAILAAKSIVELKREQELKTERMKTIVDFSREGIISLDRNGTVMSFNSAAEKIIGIKAGSVLLVNMADSSMPQSMKDLYGNGSFEVNKLAQLNNIASLVNRIPIKVNSEFEGSIITFQAVSEIQKLETRARMQLHAKGLVAKNTFANIAGSSQAIKSCISKAKRFSNKAASVLIEGETGTGKELFVQGMHNASQVREGPFVAVNCAALPEPLLESELFGYDEGAFTGAKKGGKSGLFELAHNGTIFLDEIGEVSPLIQSRLLRVLQEREILRVGGDRIIHVNVRIIAATNKNLFEMVSKGQFRNDLYFRLNVLNLRIPSLRERSSDIPVLVDHFINLKNMQYGTSVQTITKNAVSLLKEYSWPGNIRELEHFIEKLIILTDKDVVDESFMQSLLSEHRHSQRISGGEIMLGDTITIGVGSMQEMQNQLIETLLERKGGNKKLLARDLGISRVTVWNRLNRTK